MNRSPKLVSTLPTHEPLAVQRQHGCESGAPRGPVVHDHSGLGVYIEGSARFWMGRDYRLRAGDVIIVPEGMAHYTKQSDGAQMLGLAMCTHCLPVGWGETFRAIFAEVRGGGSAVRRFDNPSELAKLLGRIEAELFAPLRGSELMLNGLMYQLAAELDRADRVLPSGVDEVGSIVVMNALAVIERRAAEAVSLVDVAREVGRSPAHLASLVKEETGRTVVEWVTHARMAIARRLLTTTDDTIASVADSVGYASPSHFHRTFRREHQVSPGAWREAHRSSSQG